MRANCTDCGSHIKKVGRLSRYKQDITSYRKIFICLDCRKIRNEKAMFI